jgi:uncharacterized protein YndB with AHSA1/START domain
VTELRTSASTTIEAPAEKVWEALTTPDLIERWFFGVHTETDWKVGSPIVHTGEWQGKPYVDKGEIVRFDPPKVLVHTHWSELSGVPDEPQNYQEVTWEVEARDGTTELTITEENLPNEEAKTASEQAWGMILTNLKELLEG